MAGSGGYIKTMKRINGRRPLAITIVVLVIASFMVLIAITNGKTKDSKVAKADCTKVITRVNGTLDKEDYANSLRELKKYESVCALNKSSGWEGVVFNAQLAIASYSSGEREDAKNYAKTALQAGSELHSSEKAQIINYESMVIDLQDISKGNYFGQGGLY
jgi:hypothetical protein